MLLASPSVRAQTAEGSATAEGPATAEVEPSTQATPARARSRPIDVSLSSELASYADTDHVFVQTPSIAAAVSNPTAGWSVDGRYLVDIVSAASADIVSTASRRWEEVRHEGDVNASYKPGAFGASGFASVSSEPDYLSWTGGGALTLDTFDKNVTWLLGVYHTHDVAGRTGTPFSVFSRPINREAFKGGVTVLLSPMTVASFVGDVVVENGDQSKPYRYIPLFAPGTQVPNGAPVDVVSRLRVSATPLEQLPLSRDRFALSGRLAHRMHRATLRLDERLYADTWDMKATTTDARLLFDLGPRVETGPHARLHVQTPVSFWQRAYVFEPGFDYPALRTGDRELGPLLNATGGWTATVGVGSGPDPQSWVLGFDFNLTATRYFDDLYITHRISALGGVSLETHL